MWLIPILPIFHWCFTITQFSITVPQRTTYPLCQVGQFMKKSFYIQLFGHVGIQFNQKITGTITTTNNITISTNLLFFQVTVNNLNINFMTWEEVIQKPRGNILTEDFRITVSRMSDERHVPQCRNQTNEPTKISFSLLVITSCRDNHLPSQRAPATTHDH